MKKLLAVVIVASLMLSICSVTSMALTSSDVYNQSHSSYESSPASDAAVDYIYPIFDLNAYNEADVIAVDFVVASQKDVISVDYEAVGFDVITAPTTTAGVIAMQFKSDLETECPTLTIRVVLNGGSQIEKTVYAFVSNGKVYLDANSLYGAKDAYWADALAEGSKTE